MIKGRCECGAVAFEADAVRDTVTVCHCSQCRRTSGHLWASTHAPFDKLTFVNDAGLRWYASSDRAKRGFCAHCGSSLFYRMNGEAGIGIAAGCLEDTSALRIGKHIFVADKGDYYPAPDDAEAAENSQIARP
ncbi:UNVERIFIED_ORG: hypothetical protein BCL66_10656 [Martelella mediterranea]